MRHRSGIPGIAQPCFRADLVIVSLLAFTLPACSTTTCSDPASAGTLPLELGELREDVLCREGTVRVSVDVEGGHFYAMVGDLIGSPLGNNLAEGRVFGPVLASPVDFTFNDLDELGSTLIRTFFATSSGEVLVEVTNKSQKFSQGGSSSQTIIGDSTVVETAFSIIDTGVEDHGTTPSEATRLPLDGSSVLGTLPTGDEFDFFELAVERNTTYRIVLEATSDLRIGTARVDRFGQFNPFVATTGGLEFAFIATPGRVEAREFTAPETEDVLLGVAVPTVLSFIPLPLTFLSPAASVDSTPIQYAVSVSRVGPGVSAPECPSLAPAPTIDWADLNARAEGAFDVTCREKTDDEVFQKYVQRDPDVVVSVLSTGDRFMILHGDGGRVQEAFLAGTNVENPNNILADIRADPAFEAELGASFHSGALDLAKVYRSEIEPLLDPEKRIRVTGYSLGGAVAAILGLFLERDGFEVESVLTFGQFPVTDADGAAKFADRPLLRVKSGRDGVPDLFSDAYDHFAAMLILLDGPLFVYLTADNPNFEKATSSLRAFDPFADHLTYLDRLGSKLVNPVQVSFCDGASFLSEARDDICP